MKINSSVIGMESARRYTSVTKKAASATLMGGVVGQGSAMKNGTFAGLLSAQGEEQNVLQMSSRTARIKSYGTIKNVSSIQDRKAMESIREQCVLFLIRWLYSGMGARRMQQENQMTFQDYMNQNNDMLQAEQDNSLTEGQLSMNMNYYHAEDEVTEYATQGIVRTADGREIRFGLNLSMSRSFREYYEENISSQPPRMTDPLVINLDTSMASLSDQRFEFDIDSDGIKDSIPYLQSGSGYLALDKNGDGVIGDGSELFGTSSGDGFRDLAQYDSDGNGWIDENDEIFDKLLVWTKDESGNDALYTLKQAGVGAICLQKADTEFSLNSLKDNQTNGRIRSTGVFLYENGNVGTMQQLDLAQ